MEEDYKIRISSKEKKKKEEKKKGLLVVCPIMRIDDDVII